MIHSSLGFEIEALVEAKGDDNNEGLVGQGLLFALNTLTKINNCPRVSCIAMITRLFLR
jgi:hypothetical protein